MKNYTLYYYKCCECDARSEDVRLRAIEDCDESIPYCEECFNELINE